MAALSLALVACAAPDPCRGSELVPVSSPRLAVVLSDYSSTAIALVTDDGVVMAPWLDSGTRPPELVAALSGDVVLPRVMPTSDALVLLDRYQTDVLTSVPYASPLEGLLQVDLRGGRTSGSSPNPQDVLAWSDGRWLVSRLNPAEDLAAPELARGNDLAILDPDAGALIDRIDLAADLDVDGVHYFARPSGLARVQDGARPLVLVGLARLSSLASRLTGPGAVALVDPDARTSQVLELSGLSNCTTVAPVPSDPRRAVVLCRGDAFGEDEARAGLVSVAVEDGALVELARFGQGEVPAPGNGLVPLDAERVAYVASGSVMTGRLDRLVILELATGETHVIAESAPFDLGDGALDPSTGELLVPDGAERAIRRFDAASLEERDAIDLTGRCVPLPPRQVVAL